MKYLIYLLGVIFLMGLNFGLFNFFKLFGLVPNLLLLLVLVAALDTENLDFLFFAVSGGLLLDARSGLFFGSFSLTFLILGFLLYLLSGFIVLPQGSWKWLLAVAASGSLLAQGGLWLYNGIFFHLGQTRVMPESVNWWTGWVPFMLYDTLLILPVYFFYIWLKGFVRTVSQLYRHHEI